MATARIGETRNECDKRYEVKIEVTPTITLYRKNGFLISAIFMDGICERLVFRKVDASSIDRVEIESILLSNWESIPKAGQWFNHPTVQNMWFGSTEFNYREGTAIYNKEDKALKITSGKFHKKADKKSVQKAKEATKGF